MINFPYEIRDQIISNDLTIITKLCSLTIDYRKHFLESKYWIKIVDTMKNLDKFISFILKNKTSYPSHYIEYMFYVDLQDFSIDPVIQNIINPDDYFEKHKILLYKSIPLLKPYYFLCIDDVNILYTFYKQFVNYKYIILRDREDTLFLRHSNFTHLKYMKKRTFGVDKFSNKIDYAILQNNKNLKTIIAPTESIMTNEIFDLDVLIIEQIIVHDTKSNIEKAIFKTNSLALVGYTNIGLQYIPQMVKFLEIKNCLLRQNDVDILSTLKNLSVVAFSILVHSDINICIMTTILEIKIENFCDRNNFLNLHIEIPYAKKCIIYNWSSIDTMKIMSDSITEIIMFQKRNLIMNAILDLPNCYDMTFPICYNKITINSPILSLLRFNIDSIYLSKYDIEINSSQLKEFDLSIFPKIRKLTISDNVPMTLKK
jgi:hypothetical protein